MKIVSWNCNGAFRDYFKEITDKKSDTYVDADIYVIQECENPRDYRPNYEEYRKKVRDFAGNNYYWVGDIHSKGLGIFAKKSVKLRRKKVNGEYKHFMVFRVNDSFNLLCIWAMDPYVEMIHDFFDDNNELFNEDLILCGDFNSNAKWDKDHNTRDEKGDKKNHSNLNRKLNEKGLYSVYHCVTGEKPKDKSKVETKNTFFLYRHLNKPDHIDYFYACEKLIDKTKWRGDRRKAKKNLPNEFEILERWQWLSMSDHLPLVLNIREKKEFKKEYFLHQLTQKNFKKFGLEFVSSEKPYKISEEEYDNLKLGDIGFDENKKELTIIPDNIAYDKKTKELVIIEYKNELNLKVLKQAEKYRRVVNEHIDVFNVREYDEDGNLEKEPIKYPVNDGKIRVMIIAPEFDPSHEKDPNGFELWEVSLWDKRNNGEGEVIYKKLKEDKTIKLDVNLRDLELTEKDVIENNVPEDKREEISALYCGFRKKVMDECDVELIPITNGVAFRANYQIVCIVYFHKYYNKYDLQLHYKTDELVCPIFETNKCELCSKNRTNREHDCPEDKTNRDLGCLRNIKCKGYVGNYELILNSEEDIDFAFELFKQVYEEKTEE